MSALRKIKPEHLELLHAYGLAMAAQRDTLHVGGAVLRALGLLTMDFGTSDFNRIALEQARSVACDLELPSSVYAPDRGARDGACGLLGAIIDNRGEAEETHWANTLAGARPFQTCTVEAKEGFAVLQNLQAETFEWRTGSETLPRDSCLVVETWSWDGHGWQRTVHHGYGHVGIWWNGESGIWEAEYGSVNENARKITLVALHALNRLHERTLG